MAPIGILLPESPCTFTQGPSFVCRFRARNACWHDKQAHSAHGTAASTRASPAAVGRAGAPERQHTDSAQVGGDDLPHPDAASAQALADGKLDVEEWDPLEGQGDEVWDEEGPYKDAVVSRGWRMGRTNTGASLRGDGLHIRPSAVVLNHLASAN